MPAVPVRQRLLRNAAAYMRQLLFWRRRRLAQAAGFEELLAPLPLPDTRSDSDSELGNTLSSISSIDIDIDTDSEAGSHSDDDEEQADALYAAEYRALREHVDFLATTRVLYPHTVAKRSQLHLVLTLFKNDDPERFRRNVRVLPETFDGLLEKIADHIVFDGGSNPQLPVDQQLAITLFRLGHFGNSASVESVAQWAGTAAGTVVNATRRVMIAFLAIHDDAIRWPDARAKEEAKQWVEDHSCAAWRDGWLMVDGTLVPLSDKPGYHGEAYFDRKSNYSLNVQLITLPNLRIVDYVIGPVGSMHDSAAFCESHLYQHHDELLLPGEWIWADSAYALTPWCIAPYKKPAALEPENRTFNYHVSAVRIRSEHAVGFIKGFQSLRGLRQQIKNRRDHLRALEWIRTCIIIHTLVQDIERGDADADWEAEMIQEVLEEDSDSEDVDGIGHQSSARETPGQKKRRKLKQALFASGVTA
uniref:DDE Tnp4 domain-containing protein n=1 Tax=Mycena chlorophos TaxID=658473 RepID=A0ABQ0LIE2_MYCCL|nr:predicted protein [Mycena chlorophos]